MQILSLRRGLYTLFIVIALVASMIGDGTPLARAAVMDGIVPDASHGSLELWLDVATLPTNSTSISSWTDKSSNGFDASQPTAGFQPTYVTSNPAFTTWPTVHFDGSNDRMTAGSASAMSLTGTQPRTIIVAFKQDSTVNSTVVGYGVESTSQMFDLSTLGSQSKIFGHFHGGGYDTIGATTQTYAANQLTVATINYSGTLIELYQHDQSFNGLIASSNQALNTGDSAIKIGAGWSAYSTWNGDIAEVLIYSEVLSAQDRAAVDNYLFTKYSMTPEAFNAQFIIPAPEPSSGLLALGGLIVFRRRRK